MNVPGAGFGGGTPSNWIGFNSGDVIEEVDTKFVQLVNQTFSVLTDKMTDVSKAIGQVWYAPEAVQFNEGIDEQCQLLSKLIFVTYQDYLNSIHYAANYWYYYTKRSEGGVTDSSVSSTGETVSNEILDVPDCPKPPVMIEGIGDGATTELVESLTEEQIANITVEGIGGHFPASSLDNGDVLHAGLDYVKESNSSGQVVINTDSDIATSLNSIYLDIKTSIESLRNTFTSELNQLFIGANQAENVSNYFSVIIEAIHKMFKFIIGEEGAHYVEGADTNGIVQLMEACATKYATIAQNVNEAYTETEGTSSTSGTSSGTTTTPDPGVGPSAGSV